MKVQQIIPNYIIFQLFAATIYYASNIPSLLSRSLFFFPLLSFPLYVESVFRVIWRTC